MIARQPLRHINHRGFSLLELIMVIILAGIIASVALPKMNLISALAGPTVRDELRAALVVAKHQAQASRRNVCVNYSNSEFSFAIDTREPDTLTLPLDCARALPVEKPGKYCASGQLDRICLPDHVIATVNPPFLAISPEGRPLNSQGQALATAWTASLTQDSESWPITVEADSGFIH